MTLYEYYTQVISISSDRIRVNFITNVEPRPQVCDLNIGQDRHISRDIVSTLKIGDYLYFSKNNKDHILSNFKKISKPKHRPFYKLGLKFKESKL